MRSKTRILIFTLIGFFLGAFLLSADISIEMKEGTTGRPINRALFSYVNYQSLIDEAESAAELALKRLRLEDTFQRIAAQPPSFEPENDNQNPQVLNEEAIYPEELFSSKSRLYLGRELVNKVREEGMEPVLLLAYNLPWLSPDGNVTQPPEDPEEWAEFAVSALRSINGVPGSADYVSRVKYIEIWNEPDTQTYWQGSAEEYYRLFRTAAKRIHAEFPEVKAGGPVSLNYSAPWTLNFIKSCKDQLDYLVYHSYEEVPENLVRRVKQMGEYLRKETGNPDIKIMITESDHRFLAGAEKIDYIMRRQFGLMDVSEYLSAFHQFTARAFSEGDMELGMVRLNGTVLGYNYWPFWLFRDLIGEKAEITVSKNAHDLLLEGAISDDVRTLVLYRPLDSDNNEKITVTILVPEGFRENGLCTLSRVSARDQGIVKVIPAYDKKSISVELHAEPGSGYAVSLSREVQGDLVWTDLEFEDDSVLIGSGLKAEVAITNVSPYELKGRIKLLGVPQEWDVSAVSGDTSFSGLKPGESRKIQLAVETPSVTRPEGNGAYIYVSARPPRQRSVRMSSVPVTVRVEAPVAIQANPGRLFVTDGYKTETVIQLTNTYSEDVSGTLSIDLPPGIQETAKVQVSLPRGETQNVDFSFAVDSLPEGTYTAKAVFDYKGIKFDHAFTIFSRDFRTDLKSTAINLSDLYNIDGVTHIGDFEGYDQSGFGGRFSLPGQFMPPGGLINYFGVDFIFPDTSLNKPNLVETRGQIIEVPQGSYSRIALLATTVNSNKKEALTLYYADGTKETKDFFCTDWCVAPKFGEVAVVKAPYRHMTAGVLKDAEPQIFYLDIPVSEGKILKAVEMPERETLYIVSMSLVE